MKTGTEQRDSDDDESVERIAINSNNNNSLLSPVALSFVAKPSPPASLNNLEEAGRIRLTVHFEQQHQQYQQDEGAAEMPVKRVSAKITNNTRSKSAAISMPAMTETSSHGASSNDEESVMAHSYSAAELVQKGLDTWYGEIAIPCNWFEGGSKTYERTGSFTPYYDDNLFTMTISWLVPFPRDNRTDEEGKRSVVELHSTDAFHWEQQQEALLPS